MKISDLWTEYNRQRESTDIEHSFARCHNFAEWCDEQRRLACVVQAQNITSMIDLSGNDRHLIKSES